MEKNPLKFIGERLAGGGWAEFATKLIMDKEIKIVPLELGPEVRY